MTALYLFLLNLFILRDFQITLILSTDFVRTERESVLASSSSWREAGKQHLDSNKKGWFGCSFCYQLRIIFFFVCHSKIHPNFLNWSCICKNLQHNLGNFHNNTSCLSKYMQCRDVMTQLLEEKQYQRLILQKRALFFNCFRPYVTLYWMLFMHMSRLNSVVFLSLHLYE